MAAQPRPAGNQRLATDHDGLGPRLDAALAELDCTPRLSGKTLAETLVLAAGDFYRLDEEPADAEIMRQFGGKSEGNPLDSQP